MLQNMLFLLYDCRETSSSASTVVVDATLPGHLQTRSSAVRRGSSHTRWQDTISSISLPFTRPTSVTSAEKPRPHYFKFQLLPGKFLKIKFDRLALLALMDRWECLTFWLIILSESLWIPFLLVRLKINVQWGITLKLIKDIFYWSSLKRAFQYQYQNFN